MISAYCYIFDIRAVIFRLANIVGPRCTHGVVYDFIKKLKRNPNELEILGDGNQKKSYLYIEDCVDGMIFASRKVKSNLEIFNLGSEDWITVKEIAEIVCKELNLHPKLRFGKSNRGWKGDVPLMLLDISKIKKFGWRPKYNSRDSVLVTINSLKNYLS